MRITTSVGRVSEDKPAFTLDFITGNILTHKALQPYKNDIEQLMHTLGIIIEEYANGSTDTGKEVVGEAGSGGEESGSGD